MQYVLTNDQMRKADKHTIEKIGLKGGILMESAGKACAEKILAELRCCPWLDSGIVICGKGNNGGDGYVIARYLQQAGYNIDVWTLAEKISMNGDSAFHYEIALKCGVAINHFSSIDEFDPGEYDFVVDALLGTGTKGIARGIFVDLIDWINNQDSFIFAIDIPSGLSGDSSGVNGAAVKADHTFAIHTMKIAHVLNPAKQWCGKTVSLGIGISDHTYADKAARLFEQSDVELKYPHADDHKFSRGELLIIGGIPNMIGAVHWAGKGAMHSGAGYITLAVPESSHAQIKILAPGAVSLPLPEINKSVNTPASVELVLEHIAKTRAILMGNGMGRSEDMLSFVTMLLPAIPGEIPLIIDADGLYLVKGQLPRLKDRKLIFTPHAGELRQLFGDKIDFDLPESERWPALQKELSENWIVVAKGSPSVVLNSKEIFINSTGGEELGIAGSGDLLAGYLAGLCAFDPEDLTYNCCQANFIHGLAGKMAKDKEGIFSVTMEALCNYLPKAIKKIESNSRI